MSVKVIAFDLFGTIFDINGYSDKREIVKYGETIRAKPWRPFNWEPYWERMPPFPDCENGEALARLMIEGYYVVAMSNAPLALTMRMSRAAGIDWDAIIPLETISMYKPKWETYHFAARLCGVSMDEFLMVSANKDFGDIETVRQQGGLSQLIRHPGCPADVEELADWLKEGRVNLEPVR